MVLGLRRKSRGDWKVMFRDAMGRDAEPIVTFLETGTRPPLPEVGNQSLPYAQPTVLRATHMQTAEWRLAVGSSGVDWLEATREMPAPAQERLGVVLGVLIPSGLPPGAIPAIGRGSPPWLVFLLRSIKPDRSWLTMRRIEEAGSWLAFTTTELIRWVFTPPVLGVQTTPAAASDFTEWVTHHRAEILQLLRPELEANAGRWSAATLAGPVVLEALRGELAAALASTAKSTRAAARPAAVALGFDGLEELLHDIALSGVPGNRAAAFGALLELAPENRRDDVRDWVVEHGGADRASSVRDAVARSVETADVALGAPSDLPAVDTSVPVPESFSRFVASVAERPDLANHARTSLRALPAALAGSGPPNGWILHLVASKDAPLADLAPVHLARLVLADAGWNSISRVASARGVRLPSPLVIQAVAEADGRSTRSIVLGMTKLLSSDDCPFSTADIGEWAHRELPGLVSFLGRQTTEYELSRAGLFRALKAIDPRPDALTRALVEVGLTGFKTDRPLARAALGGAATPLVVAALSSGKVADRIGAAGWLRELRDPSTETPIREAIAKEQHDAALIQMYLALEGMGASLDEYLAPDRVAAQARAALANQHAVPPAMRWLSFDALPPVHWKDGVRVPTEVFQWFAATAVRTKSVEPSPVLRRLAAAMRPDEAHRFALALYDTWVAKDLVTRPLAVCEEAARDRARWMITFAARFPDDLGSARFRGLTEDQATQLLLPRELAVLAGSAVDSKGVLAVASALGGPELAPRVLAYLKRWRGHRLHQGKAMLGMLVGTELPAAVQVVLTVSQRFRPKGLQDEAGALVQRLAEQRGWTLDDLADRTVPRSGFDDDGRLELDYGTRSFILQLRDDLTIGIAAAESGASLKALPDARNDEDQDEVKALQNELKIARKEVKATAALQPERLRMAMCTERRWPVDDFRRYILDHPVMSRLASRLVWLALDADGSPALSFRPLADGTLIDLDDDVVTLPDDGFVKVAHEVHLGSEAGRRWEDHLRDYTTTPLFPQFGGSVPNDLDGSVWSAVRGHMISARALRGAVTKAGWQLGPAEDGGVISTLMKDCSMAELTAVLEITGVPAYMDDSVTALLDAFFVRRNSGGFHQQPVPLADVPQILLIETCGEVTRIAAAGTGYDPDYQKKASL